MISGNSDGGTAASHEGVVLSARGITKHFGAVQALNGVDLDIRAGEVVGLVGDNGAGKSTLVNILSGVLRPSTGTIAIHGQSVRIESPLHARSLGIETVYQDLALALDVSVWANLFLGRELVRRGFLGRLGWLDRRAMITAAERHLHETHVRLHSVAARAGDLSGGQRQAVAVARALSWGSRVVLMDEPTAALGVEQQRSVGQLIHTVASAGRPVLLISHNLPQVCEVCDRVVVLFRGRVVADLDPKLHGAEQIVRSITGIGIDEGARVNG